MPKTVIDGKKSHMASIVLNGVKLGAEEIRKALLTMDENVLTAERAEALISILPGDEDAEAISRFRGDWSDPDVCEPAKVFRAMLTVPRFGVRLRAMVYRSRLPTSLAEARKRVELLLHACECLEGCPMVRDVLRATLWAGNLLNGPQRPVNGFRVDGLMKRRVDLRV